MANVRDSDTSLWLHNKLGISNDSWTGGSICSQLNAEVLRNIKDCFPDLQTQVKLKLLLSFFHIPRRNIEEWRIELEQIIDVAVSDSELWVSMLAEALKTLPATGSLNTEISDLDDVRPIFTDLVNDLKRLVKKQAEHVMLPMECHYLNKVALISVVGQQPAPTKHFTLRKKPKSAILRADLLQKSNDAASNLKKASAPVIPVRSRGMPRKMTDTTPLKGIPSRVPTGGFRSGALNNASLTRPPAALARPPAGRKEGGVKLLDIADQPLGYAAKKRKKMQEMEDAAAAAAVSAAAAAAAAAATVIITANIKKEPTAVGAHNSPTGGGTTPTPDYALGLAAPTYAPATPQPTIPPTVSGTLVSPPTPSGTPIAATASTPAISVATTVISATATTTLTITTPIPTLIKTTPIHNNHSTTPTAVTIVTSKAAAQQLLQQHHQTNIVSAITVPAATAAAAVAAGAKLVAMPAGTVLTATKQQLAMAGGLAALRMSEIDSGKATTTTPAGTTATIIRQIPVSMTTGGAGSTPTVVRPVPPLLATSGAAAGQVLTATSQNPIVVTRPVQQVTQIRLQPQPAAALQRRGLALTRDQMIEAQEMFRTANKVTRPEKALILGFMAGSRDNPCPHLGNIVTIKLSEDQENVMQTDNTFVSMLVETHFQMNYNNGEWKRIKKYRHMEPSIDQLTAGSAQQAAGLV